VVNDRIYQVLDGLEIIEERCFESRVTFLELQASQSLKIEDEVLPAIAEKIDMNFYDVVKQS